MSHPGHDAGRRGRATERGARRLRGAACVHDGRATGCCSCSARCPMAARSSAASTSRTSGQPSERSRHGSCALRLAAHRRRLLRWRPRARPPLQLVLLVVAAAIVAARPVRAAARAAQPGHRAHLDSLPRAADRRAARWPATCSARALSDDPGARRWPPRCIAPTRRWPRWLRGKWLGARAVRRRALRLRAVRPVGAAGGHGVDRPRLLRRGAGGRHDVRRRGVLQVRLPDRASSTSSPRRCRRSNCACASRARLPDVHDGGLHQGPARRRRRRRSCVQRGCELALFLPAKVGNLDCTLCLDCVQACPHDNIALGSRVAGCGAGRRPAAARASARLARSAGPGGARAACSSFGALLNAFAMTAPVYALERWLSRALLGARRKRRCWRCCSWSRSSCSRRAARRGACVVGRLAIGAARAAHRAPSSYALVPFGFGVWAAHYGVSPADRRADRRAGDAERR